MWLWNGCIKSWGRLDQNVCGHGNTNLPLTFNGENGVSTFSQSFLIGSSPNLHASKTGVKSQMNSNSSRIGSFTIVLRTLEHWKHFSNTIMRKWCLYASTFMIDQIFDKVAGNQDRHKISDEFDFWPDQTSHFGVICSWLLKKAVNDIVQGIALFIFIRSLWNAQITWKGIKPNICVQNLARVDHFLWSYLSWLLKRPYWTLVNDRCPFGDL